MADTDFRDALSRLNEALDQQDSHRGAAAAYCRKAADELDAAAECEHAITELKAVVAAHLGPPADVPVVVVGEVERLLPPGFTEHPNRKGDEFRAWQRRQTQKAQGATQKPKHRKRLRWAGIIDGARARYEAGETAVTIAADLGVTSGDLHSALRRYGVPPRDPTPAARMQRARDAQAQKRLNGRVS